MTLAELNAADQAAFVRHLAGIFEQSPWVAERAWPQRPFGSVAALHAAMAAVVGRATRDEQLALLRAHPDLGSRASMSAASLGEQAGAGLDRLATADAGELRRLNAAYRERFGFPFLLAVRGSTPVQVREALRVRIAAPVDDEFAEALLQVLRITQFRLDDLIEV